MSAGFLSITADKHNIVQASFFIANVFLARKLVGHLMFIPLMAHCMRLQLFRALIIEPFGIIAKNDPKWQKVFFE